MFNSLTERLTRTLKNITGQGRLTEANITDTLREIRNALIEADVALLVLKEFIATVKLRALGQEVLASVNPSQAFIKIVHEELKALLGKNSAELLLNLASHGQSDSSTIPQVILLVGLQGAGKTTSVIKLAHWLENRHKQKVMVTSTDIRRPGAIEQLRLLANEAKILCHPSSADQTTIAIARSAIIAAKNSGQDILIIDTAGRLQIDEEMMKEVNQLQQNVQPTETLFVMDSMIGQEGVNIIQSFNSSVPLTGVILSKMDGDARAGSALSIAHLTHLPIKFIGMGEKIAALELFNPERIANRILGKGDIVSLVEQAELQAKLKAQEKVQIDSKSFKPNKKINLNDFLDMLLQLKKMGGVDSLMAKLPQSLTSNLKNKNPSEQNFTQYIAALQSMTPKERIFPDLIRSSRKQRIAQGSGTTPQTINRLIKQFTHMQKMFKTIGKQNTKFKVPLLMNNLIKNRDLNLP